MIHVLEAEDFSGEHMSARLKYEDVNHRPLMPPILEAATLGAVSALKNVLASGADANLRCSSDKVSALDVAVPFSCSIWK